MELNVNSECTHHDAAKSHKKTMYHTTRQKHRPSATFHHPADSCDHILQVRGAGESVLWERGGSHQLTGLRGGDRKLWGHRVRRPVAGGGDGYFHFVSRCLLLIHPSTVPRQPFFAAYSGLPPPGATVTPSERGRGSAWSPLTPQA